MKVKVTYKEIQHYSVEKEVEMTETEYQEYLKTRKLSKDLEGELSSLCTAEEGSFDSMEVFDTDVEILEA